MNYLGINSLQLESIAKKLNILLATYQIYYQNLRSFHWHIEGQNFFDLHQIFEELYTSAHIKIDELAERILSIRYKPLGSFSEYISHANISESKDIMHDELMITTVLENHRELIRCMRDLIAEANECRDEGTADLITSYLSDLEKRSWMLAAWKSRSSVENIYN